MLKLKFDLKKDRKLSFATVCKEGHAEIATEDERHFNIIFQGPRHTLKVTKKSAILFEKVFLKSHFLNISWERL